MPPGTVDRAMSRPLVPAFLARGSHGAVVAPHHLATAAGLGILRAGGSAVDAAIATNAVLAVVDNQACGLGGDAFWLIWDEAGAGQTGLNGSGRSSVRASAADLRTRGLRTIPHRGGVFERELGADAAGWAAAYRPAGRPWQPGERVRLPALARTLERIAHEGWSEPYEGETAQLQATALGAVGSAIGLDDLRSHTSTWTEPIFTDYRGVRVTGHPPNSSGFVALELLNILEAFEPPAAAGAAAARSDARIRWAHLGIEASKLAMADRDAHLTDPEHHAAARARLLDKDYARMLAWRIDPDQASAPAAARVPRGGGTIWLGVVDDAGNAVSLIQSNYAGFGSGIVDPATGIAYQNRGSYFSLDEDHPNVLAPSKRTLHTLMPAMLFRAGRPWVIVGSMGGDAQPQVHAQVVSALVDGGADVATAVADPRWFVEPAEHYAPPDTVRIEPRFGTDVLDGLAAMSHPVVATEPFDGALGHCHAIELVAGGPATGGTLAAATDPRSLGLPATW